VPSNGKGARNPEPVETRDNLALRIAVKIRRVQSVCTSRIGGRPQAEHLRKGDRKVERHGHGFKENQP